VLRRRESPLALWPYDRTNGEERLIDGDVRTVNETLLEIENLEDESTAILVFSSP
jgi:hypothetical protein